MMPLESHASLPRYFDPARLILASIFHLQSRSFQIEGSPAISDTRGLQTPTGSTLVYPETHRFDVEGRALRASGCSTAILAAGPAGILPADVA